MRETSSAMGAGAMWSMLDNLAQQALSFLVFLLLARIIAPQDFGLIAIAHVIVALVRQTIFDAIVQPVARLQTPTDVLFSRAFTSCLVAGLVIAMATLAGAGMVARFYRQPDLAQVLGWMSVVIVAQGAAAAYEARLIRSMHFKPLAIRSIGSVSVGGGVGIVMAMQGAGVMALVAQQVVTSGLALTLLIAQSDWRPRWSWRGVGMREFLPDSSRVALTGFFGFLTSQGDTLLVSVLMGSYATGIYSFAKRLTSAIYLVIGSSLLKLAIPAFANAGGSAEGLRDAYLRILGASLFLMGPMLVGLSVLATPAIALFFGPAWAPAAPVVAMLAALYLLLAANQVNDYVLFAVGARTVPMKRALLQTVSALLLSLWFVDYGLVAMAGAFVLAGALVWPWAQWLVNLHMHYGFLKLALALKSPVLSTACMAAVLLVVMRDRLVTSGSLLGLILLGVVVYFSAHWLVQRVSPSSHNALQDLLQLRGRKKPAQ